MIFNKQKDLFDSSFLHSCWVENFASLDAGCSVFLLLMSAFLNHKTKFGFATYK